MVTYNFAFKYKKLLSFILAFNIIITNTAAPSMGNSYLSPPSISDLSLEAAIDRSTSDDDKNTVGLDKRGYFLSSLRASLSQIKKLPSSLLSRIPRSRDHNLSNQQFESALDFAYALKQLTKADYIQQDELNRLMSNKKILSVYVGFSNIEIIDNISNEEISRLRDILYIINRMTNSSLNIISLSDAKAVLYERERLRFAAMKGGMEQYHERYKDWETNLVKFNSGLDFIIINDLSRGEGFFFDRIHSSGKTDQPEKEIKTILVKIIRDGKYMPRPEESPITDLVFPSVRNAKTLERCMRSCLVSIRGFGYKVPDMWVIDDAEGDVALEKQAMLRRLSQEFDVTINYAGPKEKNVFLDQLAQDQNIKKAGLSREDLIRIYFQPGLFGSNRNFVQSYCSGRIYTTIDDDAVSSVTIEKSFSKSKLCGADTFGIMSFILSIYNSLNEFDLPSGKKGEIKSLIEKFSKELKEEKYLTTYACFQKVLTILYAEKGARSSELDEMIEKSAKDLPEKSGEFKTGRFTYGKRTFIDSDRSILLHDSVTTITIPVNAFGVHSRLIGKSVEGLQTLRYKETEGNRVFLDESSIPGTIGIVEALCNIDGAGSSSNDLDLFVSHRDVTLLEGKSKKKTLFLTLKNFISDRYKLSTTTLVTVDNRASHGLLVPGMIDSNPLGMAVQGGDEKFKLFTTMLSLDHYREPSDIRNWQGQSVNIARRTVKNQIDEIGLMTAFRIHYGRQSEEDAINHFVNEQCVLVGKLRELLRTTKQPKRGHVRNKEKKRNAKKKKPRKWKLTTENTNDVRQTVLELIEAIRIEMGGVPIPLIQEVQRKMATRMMKDAARKARALGLVATDIEISSDSSQLATAYLALPNVKDHIRNLLRKYLKKVEEVERYSKNVHLASRSMRERGNLPFITFGGFGEIAPKVVINVKEYNAGENIHESN